MPNIIQSTYDAFYQEQFKKLLSSIPELQSLLETDEVNALSAQLGIFRSLNASKIAANKIDELCLLRNQVTSKQPLSTSVFSVDKIINRILMDYGYLFNYTNSILVDGCVGIKLVVESIIRNLTSNAKKYGKNISIVLTENAQQFILEVHNDGPPLQQEVLASLKSHAETAPSAHASGENSSGFGLTTCYRLARLINGSIHYKHKRYQNPEVRGANSHLTFTFYFDKTLKMSANQIEALRLFLQKDSTFAHDLRNQLVPLDGLNRLFELNKNVIEKILNTEEKKIITKLRNSISKLKKRVNFILDFLYCTTHRHGMKSNINELMLIIKQRCPAITDIRIDCADHLPIHFSPIDFCLLLNHYLGEDQKKLSITSNEDGKLCVVLHDAVPPQPAERQKEVLHQVRAAFLNCELKHENNSMCFTFSPEPEQTQQASASSRDQQTNTQRPQPPQNHRFFKPGCCHTLNRFFQGQVARLNRIVYGRR